jgi:glycine betaine/proline transport system ATP-binding protein
VGDEARNHRMQATEGGATESDSRSQAEIIRVENCSVVFGRRARQALEMRRSGRSKAEVERETGSTIGVYDANFGVYPGEIFVVIGLSGSGKSTLLRVINRLIEPTEGKVYLDGDLISEMPAKQLREIRRKKIGMVFQHFGLLPNRTVVDNIAFGLEIQGVSAQERKKKAEETLPEVGLEGQGNKLIAELSGGMKQRVGLARALATEQEILLMDEPFSALDALIRRDMQNLFLSIQGEVKRTVVFVTHDLDEALTLGHRVAIMKDGEIVQLGTPEQILREPANEYVERFVEGVDYAKVRHAESVMVRAKEVAYISEGPTVVLRRMRQAGLSHIFVLDSNRRLVGHCEAEEVARLAERDDRELRAAVDDAPKVERKTALREVLPLFVEEGDIPVAVVDDGDRLEGVIVRGALIAGLTTSVESPDEGGEDFSGVGARETSEVASDGKDEGGRE